MLRYFQTFYRWPVQYYETQNRSETIKESFYLQLLCIAATKINILHFYRVRLLFRMKFCF